MTVDLSKFRTIWITNKFPNERATREHVQMRMRVRMRISRPNLSHWTHSERDNRVCVSLTSGPVPIYSLDFGSSRGLPLELRSFSYGAMAPNCLGHFIPSPISFGTNRRHAFGTLLPCDVTILRIIVTRFSLCTIDKNYTKTRPLQHPMEWEIRVNPKHNYP